MSNELILEMKCEYEEAIVGITGVQDALVSFERTVSLTAITLNELSSAEESLTLKQENFEKALGLNSSAITQLEKETEALMDVLNQNGDVFEENRIKAALLAKTIEEQMKKYTEYGNTVPVNLQKAADKYGVLSERAKESKETFIEFFNNVDKMKSAWGENSSEIEKMKTQTNALVTAINDSSGSFENNSRKAYLALNSVKDQIDVYKKFGLEVPENLKKAKKEIENLSKSANALSKLDEVRKHLEGLSKIAGALDEVGLISTRTSGQIQGMLGGLGKVGEGLAQFATNPVAGTINVITGALEIGVNAFKLFSDAGVRSAIDEEREFIEISEEMEDKIVELADELDDAHAAASMYMAEIIKTAKINVDNFDNYANRTGDIIQDYEKGTLTLQQTQQAMGNAFNALLEKAQKLGTEGSKGMIDMIKRARESGIEVAQIQEYTNKKLNDGIKALSNYLSTFGSTGFIKSEIEALNKELQDNNLTTGESIRLQDKLKEKQAELGAAAADIAANWSFMQTAALSSFNALQSEGKSFIETVGLMGGQLSNIAQMARENGLEVSGGLKEMVDLADFINQNEALAGRIEATKQIMVSLGDSAYLTAQDFTAFSGQTLKQFEELISAGASEKEALRLLGPQMENLIKYSESYNFSIDDQTKKLIDKGQVAGMINKQEMTDQQKTNEILLAIAKTFGADLPESLNKFGNEAQSEFSKVQQSAIKVEDSEKKIEREQKRREAEEKKIQNERRERYLAWRDEIDKTAQSIGIMTDRDLKALNSETRNVLQVVKEHEDAWGKNTVVTEKMKEAIQAQIDKYEKYGKEVPEDLKEVADAHDIVSSKQEELKKKTEDLLASMGILSKNGMEKLNDETSSLVDSINKNADAFANNERKANLMKKQLQSELDKYENPGEKTPEELTKLAETYNVVSSATEAAKKEAESYDESLGFLSENKITSEMDKLTQSLERTKEQWKDNPELIQNMLVKMKEIEKNAKTTGAELSDDFKKGKEAVENAYNATKILSFEQQVLANILGMSNVEFMEFSETTKEIGAALSKVGSHGKEVLGFLTDTGIVSGETAKALGSLVDGVSQVGAGFAELATNPIGGAMKILGGAVDFVSGLFSLFSGDEVGDAIDKERKFIDISEEMEEKIRKLEESIGDTHAATSLLMGEIIKEADINANNFDNYVKRTHDILKDLNRGKISMQEAQEAIGKSFNELINKAQKLGTEGSKEMIAMMRDLRKRGMEVAEVQEYVNQQLQSGIEAFGNYLDTFNQTDEINEKIKELEEQLADTSEGTKEYTLLNLQLQEQYHLLGDAITDVETNFESMGTYALGLFNSLVEEGATFMEAMQAMGDQLTKLAQIAQDNGLEVSGALKELLDMQTFINQNKELVDRISATAKMLEALGNTGYLTAEIFNQFQQDARSQFEALMERTGDAKQAYQLLAPELAKMAWYATQYGYQLDDNMKKMIAEAQQHGINMNAMIPAEEKMVALMEELVTVLGGKIPYAMDKMADAANRAFGRMRDSAGEFNKEAQRFQFISSDRNSGGRGGGGPDITAAAGYSGWVNKPTSFLIGEGGEPEFVSVIPRSRMYVYPVNDERYNSKDGDIVFEHITIYSENGEETVREFMTAIKNNKYGVQNLIRKVVQ